MFDPFHLPRRKAREVQEHDDFHVARFGSAEALDVAACLVAMLLEVW